MLSSILAYVHIWSDFGCSHSQFADQNSCQKAVNRGAWRLCRGGLTFKFNIHSTDLCFIFQFGGAKPTKAPCGDGTGAEQWPVLLPATCFNA